MFEIVRTTAGWHARIRATNGNIIMSSEVYTRRRGAMGAIAVALEAAGCAVNRPPSVDPDDPSRILAIPHGMGEEPLSYRVDDVDER